MAIVVKPNQAFAVSPAQNCGCGGNYCQPVANGDTYTIQGYSSVNTGNTILSPNGWNLDTGWYQNGGYILGYGVTNDTTDASNTIEMVQNEWYLIGAEIRVLNCGGVMNKNIDVVESGNFFNISSGDYTFSFIAGMQFYVYGSANNDGILYTVVNSVYTAFFNSTAVFIVETVITDTAFVGSFAVNITSSLPIHGGYRVKANGEYLKLPTLTLGGFSEDANKYYWFYRPSSITSSDIAIEAETNLGFIEVKHVQVYKVSTLGLSIYDINGNIIGVENNTAASYYYEDVYYSDSNDTLEQPYLNWEWQLLLDGFPNICNTQCLFDTQWTLSDSISNPNFDTDLNFWTAGEGWFWNSGAEVDSSHAGSLTQQITFEGGTIYNLEFSVFPNGLLFYYTVNGVATPEASYTGVVQQTIDLTSYTGNVTVNLVFTGVDNVATILLYARIVGVADRRNCFNCVTVQDADASCTLKFTATNNDNAFGFDYSHGLTHELRLEAKMVVSGFPEEKEEYLFSDNSRKLLFARRDTEYEISVTDAPDYIHECLSMMRLNDTFTIDGVEYIADGNYDLRKRKTSDLKQAVFTVKKKQGIASNYSCS